MNSKLNQRSNQFDSRQERNISLKRVRRADDGDVPFKNINIVDKSSRETIHRVLAEI